MSKFYIAYGSNLNVGQMRYRCPDARPMGTTQLKGFRLIFRGNSRTGVANIEPCKSGVVPVAVWKISDRDERALDHYEGFPYLYRKEYIPLLIDGIAVDAMVYVMTGRRAAAMPSDYYYNVIRQGYEDFKLDGAALKRAYQRTIKEIDHAV